MTSRQCHRKNLGRMCQYHWPGVITALQLLSRKGQGLGGGLATGPAQPEATRVSCGNGVDTERAGTCDSHSRKRHVEMRGFKPDGTAFQSLRQTALMCVVTTGWLFTEKAKEGKPTPLPLLESTLPTNQR